MISALSAWDIWLFAASPFIGSFISEAARVWPSWSNVLTTRSSCAPCGKPLTLQELAPVFSFVVQKSRCKCGARRLPLIHPIGDALFVGVVAFAILAADGWQTLFLVVTGGLLLFAALVDARTMLLPDVSTLGLLACGLIARALFGLESAIEGALGAVVGYAVLFSVNFVFRGLKGRDGLGGGDAKLFAAGGAIVGVSALPLVLVIAATLSLCALAIFHLQNPSRPIERLAFGPSLAAAIFAVLLMQTPLGVGSA